MHIPHGLFSSDKTDLFVLTDVFGTPISTGSSVVLPLNSVHYFVCVFDTTCWFSQTTLDWDRDGVPLSPISFTGVWAGVDGLVTYVFFTVNADVIGRTYTCSFLDGSMSLSATVRGLLLGSYIVGRLRK